MPNDPVLTPYSARSGRRGGVEYERIGCTYPHKRRAGLTVELDALPAKGSHNVLLELYDLDHGRLGCSDDLRDGDSQEGANQIQR
jgi:hypothetical protein